MQTQNRRPQQPARDSKKSAEVTSKAQPVRGAPAPLDEKALRHVGGGLVIPMGPCNNW
jgi:hypothetical protein